MPERKGKYFHLVIRPRKEYLPDRKELREWFESKCDKLCISAESGREGGEYNHYDIWVRFRESVIASNIKRSVCNRFGSKWDDIQRKNVKCYPIDEGKEIYQLGYALKEGSYDLLGITEAEASEASKVYENLKPAEADITEILNTVDKVANSFLMWIETREHKLKLDGNECQHYWLIEEWMKCHKKAIPFSTYQKIKKESLIEWVRGMRE